MPAPSSRMVRLRAGCLSPCAEEAGGGALVEMTGQGGSRTGEVGERGEEDEAERRRYERAR